MRRTALLLSGALCGCTEFEHGPPASSRVDIGDWNLCTLHDFRELTLRGRDPDADFQNAVVAVRWVDTGLYAIGLEQIRDRVSPPAPKVRVDVFETVEAADAIFVLLRSASEPRTGRRSLFGRLTMKGGWGRLEMFDVKTIVTAAEAAGISVAPSEALGALFLRGSQSSFSRRIETRSDGDTLEVLRRLATAEADQSFSFRVHIEDTSQ